MVTATKHAPPPRLFEFDRIVKARDLADERLSLCETTTDIVWWSRLRDAMEEMLAGERDEDELGDWVGEYELQQEMER